MPFRPTDKNCPAFTGPCSEYECFNCFNTKQSNPQDFTHLTMLRCGHWVCGPCGPQMVDALCGCSIVPLVAADMVRMEYKVARFNFRHG